ncbi:MAG TPA: 30S ribosome-binding factor RbfA [Haliangiales bacterium]|nr:30S ribosome-binding factor RbfA [Haliangiales bacterium]
MTDRAARLGHAIRGELCALLAREVKDPRVQAAGLVTVTRVEVSPDLGVARIGVSFVGGDEAHAAAAVKALGRAAGWLRGEVGRKLSLRRAPELRFVHDRAGEHAERIDRLLKGEE